MSCELGKCESSNLANNYQDCSSRYLKVSKY